MSSFFVKSGLVLAICSALSACGGSDNDSPVTAKINVPKTTIKVIDGYIQNADVYLDANDNNIGEQGEFIGTTDENGEIAIETSKLTHPLIAKIVEGKSQDKDQVGKIAKSYNMIAPTGDKAITPFTTYAIETGKTLSDIASQFNINESLITGDYISTKNNDNIETVKAHAIARALASSLTDNNQERENPSIASEKLDKISPIITAEIQKITTGNNLQEEIKTLDDTTITINIPVDKQGNLGDAKIELKKLSGDLESTLTARDNWTFASLNSSYFHEEGFYSIHFDKNTHQATEVGDNYKATATYTITENRVSAMSGNDGIIDSTVIFSSPELLLSVANDNVKDLGFWSDFNANNFTAPSMSADMFAGKTWFYVFDDSESHQAELKLMKFDFSQASVNVTLNDGNTVKGTWSIGKSDTINKIQKFGKPDVLKIALDDDNAMDMMLTVNTNGTMLVYVAGKDDGQFSLLINSKNQTDDIFKSWTSAEHS